MAKKRELLIGVIGAGGRGLLSAHAHQPKKGVRVVAGAELNPDAEAEFRERIPDDVYVTKDYREILERKDIGAVFVTTPDFLHEEHTLAAIEAGKSVYLEKPMAITLEGCDRILKAAYRRKVRLFLGHNMRYMDFVLKMRELIHAGAIGEVKAAWCRHFVAYGGDAYFKDWHADRRRATSLLLQKGAHDIDVLHWLCGGYTKRVNALGGLVLYDQIKDRHSPKERGNAGWSVDHWPPLSQKGLNPVIDVEDLSMMQMELDNGVFCSYQQCHFTPDGWRNYTIIGTEGRIENFGDAPGSTVVRLWNRRTHYNPYGDQQFYIPPVKGGHGGADGRIVQAFIDYVRSGKKVSTSPVAARNAVAAGCMAAESLRHGGAPQIVPALPRKVVEYFEKDVANG